MKKKPEAFILSQTRLGAHRGLPEIKLHGSQSSEAIWRAVGEWKNDPSPDLPFWAFAWPGGVGLARYILDHPETVRGKRVIDMACGSGLDGIAAMLSGAKSVTAVDIDPLAICATKMNAAANGVKVKTLEGIRMERAPRATDLIIAGDVCYEHIMSHRILKWFRLCAAEGIEVIMADPGRAYLPQEGLAELGRREVPTSREIEEEDSREVVIWKLLP